MLVSLSKWLLWWYIAFSQFPKCFSSPSLKVQRSQTSHWTSLWGHKTFFIVSKNRLLNFLFSLSVNCYLKIAVIFARVPNSFMASYISYLCLMDSVISQLVSKCSISWHRSTIGINELKLNITKAISPSKWWLLKREGTKHSVTSL